MGAWIEISFVSIVIQRYEKSHPTMGAWIEILILERKNLNRKQSHPTMGAWIEIRIICVDRTRSKVAPHDGCVD